MKQSTATATMQVALAACCFGSITILASIAGRGGASLLTILVGRYLVGAGTLFALIGGSGVLRAAAGRRARLITLGGGGQAVIGFTSLLALRWIPVATLVFLFYTYPSWIAVIAAVRRTERLDGTRIAALAMSLAGIAVMVGAPSTRTLHPAGVALALGSALLYALYVPFIGWLSDGIPARAASALVATGAGLAFMVVGVVAATLNQSAPAMMSAATRGTLALSPVMEWSAVGAILALAIVSTALAFILFLEGLATLGPVRTGIISTVEPFWAALLGAVVLHEPLSSGTLIGGAAIASAVMLLQLRPAAPVTAAPRGESIS